MNERGKKLKRYYRQISRLLPCSRKQKKAILSRIQDTVNDTVSENPEISFEQLRDQFGAPETVAASYVENAGTAEILKSLQIRRRILGVVTAAAVLVLLMWAGVVTWAAIKANWTIRSLDGSHDEVFIIVEPGESNSHETDSFSVAP